MERRRGFAMRRAVLALVCLAACSTVDYAEPPDLSCGAWHAELCAAAEACDMATICVEAWGGLMCHGSDMCLDNLDWIAPCDDAPADVSGCWWTVSAIEIDCDVVIQASCVW